MSYNPLYIIDGDKINIGASEGPSIFCLFNNRVDTTGTYTDVKTPVWASSFCSRSCLYRVPGLDQIRYVMDIAHFSRNGRARVILRSTPVSYAAAAYQQGSIECLHHL